MSRLQLTCKHSAIGTSARQRAQLKGLGLRHPGQVRVLENTPAVRGMVKRVLHLIDVSEVD
jgi:large subunit ribosomal protein L30